MTESGLNHDDYGQSLYRDGVEVDIFDDMVKNGILHKKNKEQIQPLTRKAVLPPTVLEGD